MGNCNSSHETPRPPPSINYAKDSEFDKLNGSGYILRTPSDGGEPDVDVIFFHGLQPPNSYEGAYWRTWLSRDNTVVWPQKWLGERVPKARILSISYDSAVLRSGQHPDPYKITENLIRDIVLDKKCAAGRSCPVILVGHSLGGIIIKQFILGLEKFKEQYDRNDPGSGVVEMEKFLENCKGVFLYSSPQAGSNLAEYLKRWPVNTPIVDLLTVLGAKTARINEDFRMKRGKYDIKTAAIFELHETEYWNFKDMVVPEASNRIDLDRMAYTTEANHFEVCKAVNKYTDCIINHLVDFIEERANVEVIPVARVEEQSSSELC